MLVAAIVVSLWFADVDCFPLEETLMPRDVARLMQSHGRDERLLRKGSKVLVQSRVFTAHGEVQAEKKGQKDFLITSSERSKVRQMTAAAFQSESDHEAAISLKHHERQSRIGVETLLHERVISTKDDDELQSFPSEEEIRKYSIDAERMPIPEQLVMTGPGKVMDSLPEMVKNNIAKMLHASPRMRLRYLSDEHCFNYLKKYPAHWGLVNLFKHLQRGSYRGDICRIAVLYREGGFYLDLDVDLHIPLHDLVDETTSFMSVHESTNASQVGVLNAVMAVKPWSTVMRKTIGHLYAEYYQQPNLRNVQNEGSQLGPLTLGQGVADVLAEDCPEESIEKRKRDLLTPHALLRWRCGPHNFTFFCQRQLDCGGPQQASPLECLPARRMNMSKPWLNFGIFKPGVQGELVAFSRLDWCEEYGCHIGGRKEAHWSVS